MLAHVQSCVHWGTHRSNVPLCNWKLDVSCIAGFYYVKLATIVGEAHGIAQPDQLLLKLVLLPLN
jgi:hypothetical protein